MLEGSRFEIQQKRVNSVSVRVRSSRIKVRIFGLARFSFDSVIYGSGLDSATRLGPTRLDSVDLASTQSTRADSVNSVDPVNSVRLSENSTRKTRNIVECTLASLVLETTSQSCIYLVLHMNIQVAFLRQGTVGIGDS
ncbi:hypothetical protein Hdeb2414_s0223g00838981 [Helianthus debilis subsp. tardiflorus]